MKVLSFLIITLLLGCLGAPSLVAQADGAKEVSAGSNAKPATETNGEGNDKRTAAQLFDEADKYVQKKFAAFEKAKMPYDRQVDEKVKKEQRELAGRYAALLAARKLTGQELYYLGLLYNLAVNRDASADTMRRYLIENPEAAGEPAQNARAIIVLRAAKKGELSEAESRLAEYAKNEPQVPDDRYTLENW